MKFRYYFLISIVLLLTGFNSQAVSGETLDLTGTHVSISVTDTNSDSDTITLGLSNSPTLPEGAVYQVSLINEILLNRSNAGDLVSEERILEYGRVITVTLEYQGESYDLFQRTVESGAWTHFGHVMVSWPFCQGENCVPGAIGFAMGAQQDVGILSTLITSLDDNKTHTVEVAEQIINTIHGTNIDYNSDGTGVNPADGYGLTNYTYGMREHIFNTRAALSDTTSQMYNNVSEILNEIDQVVYDGTPSNPANENLNSSNKLLPSIFQIASTIIDNPTAFTTDVVNNLTSTINTIDSIINEKYYEYRSAVFDFDFTISDLSITLDDPNSSDEDDSSFPIFSILPVVLLIPIIKSKRTLSF